MKKVYRYTIIISEKQIVTMPRGAQFLSVIEQADSIQLYALVDPDAPEKPYEVFLRGTGIPIDDTYLRYCDFVGTVKMRDGFVWHIFVEM